MTLAIFHTQLDLEKLAAALEDLGFIREPLTEQGRADRAAADDWPAEPAEADPWATDEPRQEGRSQERSAPREDRSRPERAESSAQARGNGSGRQPASRNSGQRGGQRGSRGASRGGTPDVPESGTHTDGVGKEWTFGLDDAPECDCGLTAAEVTKPRAKWRAWACPVGFGKNYKNKCEFWEYQD